MPSAVLIAAQAAVPRVTAARLRSEHVQRPVHEGEKQREVGDCHHSHVRERKARQPRRSCASVVECAASATGARRMKARHAALATNVAASTASPQPGPAVATSTRPAPASTAATFR